MCMSKLSIHKSVQSPADPAILCLHVDVFILFFNNCHTLISLMTLITYYLYTVIGHNTYGMSLCITYLDGTMFDCVFSVHVCFLSPFIVVVALQFISGECFTLFYYSIYRIICMLSELVPEILLSCDGCCFNMFAVPSYYVAWCCDFDCIGSFVVVVIAYANNCSMSPRSSILLLNCYSTPY